MPWIDGETGLPVEVAEKIKERFKALEEENLRLKQENEQLKQKVSDLESENQSLKDQIFSLQAENGSLRQKITEIENGSLGVRKVSDENGDRIEFAPSQEFITQLTADGVLKPIAPNILKVGDDENYLNDVVTANITIPSLSKFKEGVRDLDPSMLEIRLPLPKIYERVDGRGGVEIGFLAEELPEFLRRGDGYDLKALVAILALKVSRLEEELSKLKTR